MLAELSDSKAKLGELKDENSVIKASLESAQKHEGELTKTLAAATEQAKQEKETSEQFLKSMKAAMNSAAAEAKESLEALQETLARKDHEHSEALKQANDELTSLKRFLN